jgi:hypothetical protein
VAAATAVVIEESAPKHHVITPPAVRSRKPAVVVVSAESEAGRQDGHYSRVQDCPYVVDLPLSDDFALFPEPALLLWGGVVRDTAFELFKSA